MCIYSRDNVHIEFEEFAQRPDRELMENELLSKWLIPKLLSNHVLPRYNKQCECNTCILRLSGRATGLKLNEVGMDKRVSGWYLIGTLVCLEQ